MRAEVVAQGMQLKYGFWKNWKNPFFLFIFYLAAHFLLLFSRVIMWDGWLWADFLRQKDYGTLWDIFSQTSLVHIYAVYRVIDALGDPVAIANFLVFTSWFAAGLAVYFILKDFAKIGEKNAFFASAVFLVAPIFIVRFEISMITYSLSNALFFLGSYAFLRSGKVSHPASGIVLRILAAALLIGSFFTASFLVFYWALIIFAFFLFLKSESLHVADISDSPKRMIAPARSFLKRNIFWVLLPFIFYFVHHKIIGVPHGLYAGYNSFVFSYSGITFLSFLSITLERIFQFIIYGFFWPVMFSFSVLPRKMFFAVFLIFLAAIFLFERKFRVLSAEAGDDSDKGGASPRDMFVWGILLFGLGSVAYILVGESPNPYGSGFDMRHGLILALGFSLIILSAINGLLVSKMQKPAKIILLAIFIVYNIYNYYALDMDWYKQMGIIQSLREQNAAGQIGERDIFVFYDKLPLYKWRGRSVKDHEFTAYLYEATGNSKLMGTSVGEDLGYVSAVKKDKLDFKDEKTLKRFKYVVIKSDISQEPTVANWVRLKIADWFGSGESFSLMIKNVIGINASISALPPEEASWFRGSPLIR